MIGAPYFDGAEIELLDEPDPGVPGAAAALAAFLRLTPADRVSDSRHVFAYYRDYHEAVGGEDWLDAQMGVPETPADIWAHVAPKTLELRKGRGGDDTWYVMVEADCAWEEEHGLLLVWRNGTTLNKVGGYDGHATNENAYADSALRDVVYAATDPAYTTRLDDPG